MKAEEARRLIALCDDPEEPTALPASALSELTIRDLPEDVAVQIALQRKASYISIGAEGSIAKEIRFLAKRTTPGRASTGILRWVSNNTLT